MSDENPEGPSLDLGRYWAVVRTRWLVVVLCGAVGCALAVLYLVATPSSYTATTLVNLNVIADQPFNNQRNASGLIDPATEAQLAGSSTVLRDAARALGGGTTVADVQKATTVTVLPATTVARITYTASSKSRAIAGADAVARAFVDYRTRVARAKVDRIVAQLDQQRKAVTKDLATVNLALLQASGSQRAAAMSQRQVLQAQLNALLTQLSTVSSIDTSGGYLITSAADNPVSVHPRPQLVVAVGLASGLLVGLVLAFLLSALDRRVASAADVARARGGLLLARLADRGEAVPSQADADAYRSSAEQLLALGSPGRSAFLVVDLTSRAQPTVAANLALGLASAGTAPVSVVFPGGWPATADTLVEECGGSRVGSPYPSIPAGAVRLASSGAPTTGDAAGPVVVALGSSASRSSILAAARHTGWVVLVVERKRTSRQAIRPLVDQLAVVGGTVVGTVMVPRLRGRRRRQRFPGRASGRPEARPAPERV